VKRSSLTTKSRIYSIASCRQQAVVMHERISTLALVRIDCQPQLRRFVHERGQGRAGGTDTTLASRDFGLSGKGGDCGEDFDDFDNHKPMTRNKPMYAKIETYQRSSL
jgi:hypothetical protein